MKNLSYFAALLGVVAISFSSCCDAPQTANKSAEELKVLVWNIWHGGHSKAYPDKGCEGTLGMLKKSEADVILMIETYGSSAQVADHLGFYHRLLSSNLSIYSRYPIIETYTFPDSISTFNFGGVMIDVDGKKMRVFDTWLHYLPDARLVPTDRSVEEIIAWDDAGSRDDEVRKILAAIEPFLKESDSIPVIMGGDFNGHSHLDWTEATKDMYDHGGVGAVNWTVSKEMVAAGFKDSFREINTDPAKNPGTTWIHPVGRVKEGEPWRNDRIDYLYYKGVTLQAVESESHNANLEDMYDFKGEKFFYGSDHGFVLTTFDISK